MAEDNSAHAAAVQAELQNYLNSKNFHTMFSLMVENLLTVKPHNPIGHIVEYLVKTYPEETKEVVAGFAASAPS